MKKSHGRPCFFAGKRTFAYFMDNHHEDGRVALWCKSTFGDQQELVDMDPERFFVPPYVGSSGWIGVRVEADRVDWKMVEEILKEAHRLIAPKARRSKPRV